MDFLNTWGFYRGFAGRDDELVDDQCREILNSMKPHGKVFHCTEVDGESITIEYRKMKFKVALQG